MPRAHKNQKHKPAAPAKEPAKHTPGAPTHSTAATTSTTQSDPPFEPITRIARISSATPNRPNLHTWLTTRENEPFLLSAFASSGFPGLAIEPAETLDGRPAVRVNLYLRPLDSTPRPAVIAMAFVDGDSFTINYCSPRRYMGAVMKGFSAVNAARVRTSALGANIEAAEARVEEMRGHYDAAAGRADDAADAADVDDIEEAKDRR